MLMWPYKFLGKTLLSPSLHVFAKSCYFITCELDEIYNLLYSISARVGGCSESCRVQLSAGREDSSVSAAAAGQVHSEMDVAAVFLFASPTSSDAESLCR